GEPAPELMAERPTPSEPAPAPDDLVPQVPEAAAPDDSEMLAATLLPEDAEALDEDLPVIEVLELLEALDSLEGLPRG
ncbi:MAG: hypothetical protein QNK05_24530, partial [Myxococcota bacterium]|nr:hypothetical protein [Myxococcota bacterium]